LEIDSMSIAKSCRKVIRKIVFGDAVLPQAFTIGLVDPQTEITVWLHGMGAPIDITRHHSMACADPFTVCIAFSDGYKPSVTGHGRLLLKFREKSAKKRVLGEIVLDCKKATVLVEGSREFILFEARSSTNYCLSRLRICAYYLFYRYSLWRKIDVAGIQMSSLERRAVMVMFIRPHPVVLVSLGGKTDGNIFPMNIMGELDGEHFAFALKNSRLAARLVTRAGFVALSDVPLSHTSLAYRLGANHGRQSIDWSQLPFATRTSEKLNIPVPMFSCRTRELEIKTIRNLGSHTFFIARIIHTEQSAGSVGLHIVHGFYQAWRLRERPEELKTSLADDVFNKRGTPYSSLPL
jgi:flavin reductase (DIM6/NTAB) family NADH-FMN oxidoreductase RutF